MEGRRKNQGGWQSLTTSCKAVVRLPWLVGAEVMGPSSYQMWSGHHPSVHSVSRKALSFLNIEINCSGH